MLIPRRRWFQAAALVLVVAVCAALTPALAQDATSQDLGAQQTGAPADSGSASDRGNAGRPGYAGSSGSEGAEEPEADADGSDFSVLRAYICRGIEQSEPTEAGKSFIPAPDGVLHLWCFSEIGGPARSDTVFHIWYWGEREMARVPLEVRGPRWRTWSTKQILDEWSGEWHVDVTDRAGVVLSRLGFSLEQPRE
jgi:hypothetical protein